ncbi:MAG: hypothetical protein U9R11_01570 [Chloroflexota bacterium]|nr:hypothetical protein [Chloroflexota bacterium]
MRVGVNVGAGVKGAGVDVARGVARPASTVSVAIGLEGGGVIIRPQPDKTSTISIVNAAFLMASNLRYLE